jgi:hypothetical protein
VHHGGQGSALSSARVCRAVQRYRTAVQEMCWTTDGCVRNL